MESYKFWVVKHLESLLGFQEERVSLGLNFKGLQVADPPIF